MGGDMSTISASTTTTTAFGVTADTTGALVFQTGATPTTALTIDTSQNVTLAGTLSTTGITNTGVATATRFNPTGSSVTGNGMYLPAANSLGLSTNGTNALYIDSSQNVNVGATSNVFGSRLGVTSSSAFPSASITSSIAGSVFQKTTNGAGNQILIVSNNNYNYGVIGVNSADGTAAGDVFCLGYTASGGAAATPAIKWTGLGYVTMSAQPSFSAYRDAGHVSSNNIVVFNGTRFNQGSNYNTSNGRFTAPITGKYFVSASGMLTGQTSGDHQLIIRVNGSQWLSSNPAGSNGNTFFCLSAIVPLTSADYVDIYYYDTGAANSLYATASGWNSFSMQLIS